MTGERIPPVVEEDGGGDEINEEYLRTDQCFSMLDIYIYVYLRYNLNKFRNWLFTSMCFSSVTQMCYWIFYYLTLSFLIS